MLTTPHIHLNLGRRVRPHPLDAAEPADQHSPHSADEVVEAIALTTVRMLATGRRLGCRPLLHTLSADELIDFWADRPLHAGPHGPH